MNVEKVIEAAEKSLETKNGRGIQAAIVAALREIESQMRIKLASRPFEELPGQIHCLADEIEAHK